MSAGVTGRLIAASFAADLLPDLAGVRAAPPDVERAIARWNAERLARLGPASSARAVSDVAAIPLFATLGYGVSMQAQSADRCRLLLRAGTSCVPALVTPWSASPDAVWRELVAAAVACDARWCFCTNGRVLRLADARRTWTRHFLDVELDALAHLAETLRIVWSAARAEAVAGPEPPLDRFVELSARHGTRVCRALAEGVLEALHTLCGALAESAPRGRLPPAAALLDRSLIVLYRVLFLLFAEARGLVPVWHPVYRDRYTVEAIVETLAAGRRHRGTWQALQAIARLAHAGCRAGELSVTAFNGALFSPAHAAGIDRHRVDDRAMGRALLAVGTTRAGGSRTRIRYQDLDVEQLGAVYEQVLDYEAVRGERRVALRRGGDARKATGTFYTPRTLAGCLVRRTLAPLVRGRTAAEILRLRVVDPAMGSGAFLVTACRYLAAAAEEALVRDGEWRPDEATPHARVLLRREVAQRCLYGVDLNPMAVQLARLSLWLATLAGDRPLTFLDHRLAVGDSLTGAALADVCSRPPGGARRAVRALPLFDPEALHEVVRAAVDVRLELAATGDADVQTVRRKEAALAGLRGDGAGLTRWRRLLDLWCACWFDDRGPDRAIFHALADALLRGGSTLPPEVERAWRERAASIAGQRRFLHWEVEFPEVFFDAGGRPSSAGGFDAVIGNPPWDMVRGDSGDAVARSERRVEARRLVGFVRGAGVYAAEPRGHVNRYQLFLERALQITRPGGRIGLVLPSGLVSDAGAAPLRRHLFDRAEVDSVIGLDNRAGIFPIHRSVRFVLLTATTGRPTERIACRFGVADPSELDGLDEDARGAPAFPVTLSRAFLARLSGDDDLAMPSLPTALDLRIVEKISARHPWLSAAAGWHVSFGRELNATDDGAAFVAAGTAPGARPVLEGKQVTPFRAAVERATLELRQPGACAGRVPRRPRLAYRDVASATNRLTLIAAIVPARAVTTHTLCCLRTPLAPERQLVLCALMNSLVANYLVRLRVHTHVTAAIVSRLPVPVVGADDPAAPRLAALARALAGGTADVEATDEYAELQAAAAWLYGLTADELAHVLGTFPLIPPRVRARVADAFRALRAAEERRRDAV